MDDCGISRPRELPANQIPWLLIIMGAALAIGLVCAFLYFDSIVNYQKNQQAAAQTEIDQGAHHDLPVLTDLAGKSAEEIKEVISDEGYELIDVREVGGSTRYSIDLIKVPGDSLSVAQISQIAISGVRGMSLSDVTKYYLNSWRLTQETDSKIDIAVKYVDLINRDAEAAITAAMETQGIKAKWVDDEGVDENENTYKTGTMKVDDKKYKFTVSACDLPSSYQKDGLPSRSQYVGIRLVEV